MEESQNLDFAECETGRISVSWPGRGGLARLACSAPQHIWTSSNLRIADSVTLPLVLASGPRARELRHAEAWAWKMAEEMSAPADRQRPPGSSHGCAA